MKKEKSNYQKREGLFEKVYEIVRTIPEGNVATYGQIAKLLGTRDPRKVGWALHANKDLKTPCHRVVSKEGRVAKNFAFDGEREQVIRLKDEGVKFKDEFHVDLEKYLWNIKDIE